MFFLNQCFDHAGLFKIDVEVVLDVNFEIGALDLFRFWLNLCHNEALLVMPVVRVGEVSALLFFVDDDLCRGEVEDFVGLGEVVEFGAEHACFWLSRDIFVGEFLL